MNFRHLRLINLRLSSTAPGPNIDSTLIHELKETTEMLNPNNHEARIRVKPQAGVWSRK
jgi:hypothetical protein